MAFHALLGEATGVDLEQIVCSVRGPFDESALLAAFQAVAARHGALRTRFSDDVDGRPVQEVVGSVEIPVERLDLSGGEPSARAARFAAALAEDRARGIELGHAPAMRLTVVDWGPDRHCVLWTFHHALMDGRSFTLVLREVFAFYDAAVTGRRLEPPSPRPYHEYIGFLRGLDLASAEAYWRYHLAGFTAPTPLIVDRSTPDNGRTSAIRGVSEVRLSLETTARLRDFAASRGVTLNSLLQAAWALVLHRYGREMDIVFGVTRACRRSAFADADEMVGLFINTLPVRVRLDPGGRLDALLASVRAQQVRVREHEHTPLVKVQNWSEVPRGRPLFETVVVYEEATLDATLRAVDAGGARLAFAYHGQTNYPLALVAYGDDQMLLRLEHDRRRVDDAPAARMLGHLATLLAGMPDHGERPLHELAMLTAAECGALSAAAAAPVAFGPDRCLHQRFEERAQAASERVAAVCGSESLTYGALDRRANAVAHELRSLGVGPEVLVGLRTERSLDLVVGILGILKAGGAYLPLDPAYPKARVDFMLADSGVSVVVTETGLAADFDGVELVLLDTERDESQHGPETGVQPGNLAYVIYTSGSTGKPKGVLVSHHNVTRLFDASESCYAFAPDDVWTLFHSYAFDFSVWELWGALLHGGRLVVVPYWISRSPEAFHELLLREGVTVLNQTPSAFGQLIAADVRSGPAARTALRHVILGGEALEPSMLKPWFDRHGDAQPHVVNMYGITETTVHVTYRPITRRDLKVGARSVIGQPISDLKLLLLDPHGTPVPTGVPAELYVGGAGVARGYLDRPELTASRFVPDPSPGDGRAKLYRTGDLARRLEDGDLEYMGRVDDQVKVRGFRIELGEIEAALGQHPDVSDAAVIVRDGRLLAYLVGAGEADALVEAVRAQLQDELPEYMVPARFQVLDALPLTPNGKLDRKALPAPDDARSERAWPYLAPRTPTEESLAAVWASVLGVSRVSADDNFFELGGDSILTIQVIARCRQAGIRFSPRDLAERPTIARLAEVAAPSAETEPEAGDEPVTPTPIQRWFFERRFADPHHWNQAFLFEVAPNLDVEAMRGALDHVVAHHDALRLRVAGQHPDWILTPDPSPAAVAITRIGLEGLAAEDRSARIEMAATAAQSGLNLHRGPLLSAIHVTCDPAPGRLLLVVHHLAVDGVSWRLLVEDLEAAYRALQAGSPVELPPRTSSFGRWSQALADYAATAAPRAALPRWLEVEAMEGALPEARPEAGENRESSARNATVSLDAEETHALLRQVPAAYRTEINDVLLTALALALRGWSGRDAHRIDLEGHGREEWIGALDLSRTVGWFTTLYPVALDLSGADDDGAALRRVKEGLRRVPDRGLSYGVLRYGSREPTLVGRAPADLLFNYLGRLDQVVGGSELLGFAHEPTGAWHGPANERTHRLEVVAAVRDGRFEARWLYGAERDRPEVVERLAHAFITALRRVIEHCVAPDAGGFTPSDFPLARLEQGSLDRLAAEHPGLEDVYPLSPMQRLFHSMEGSGGGLGFEQWVFRLSGPLDPGALRAAWDATLARHATLRTAFATAAGSEPLQMVERQVALPWASEDWSGSDVAARTARLETYLRSDRKRGFDVAVAPLSRVTLIRWSGHEHRLVWSTHHLQVDGWSWPLVIGDVGGAYRARLEGVVPPPVTSCRYSDYVGWLEAAAPDSREFWTERLRAFTSPTPIALEPTPTVDAAARESSTRLDAPTTAAIEHLARTLRVTLNTVVQGGWAIGLSHLSGRDDVVFGAAYSGRPPELEGIETLVGPCVNNVPVPVRLDPERRVSDWLREVHDSSLEIAQHQYASLPDIQRWADVPWRHRLFDSLVVFQSYLVDESVLRWGAVEVEPLAVPERTNYPITLVVTPGAELGLRLEGQGDRFGAAALATVLDGLATVLVALAERPDASLRDIRSVLPAATKGLAARVAAAATRRRQATFASPSSETERVVAEVWQELFGLDEVGRDDNFFDLGGHSILLVQAHARLRERLRADLPVVALLQFPTVRSLARHLAGGPTPAPAASSAVRDRADRQRQALVRQRSIRERR